MQRKNKEEHLSCSVKGCGKCNPLKLPPIEQRENKWRDKVKEDLKILISRGHECVINHEECEEYDKEIDAFISQTIDTAIAERDKEIVEIIKEVWGYKPCKCIYKQKDCNCGNYSQMFSIINSITKQ